MPDVGPRVEVLRPRVHAAGKGALRRIGVGVRIRVVIVAARVHAAHHHGLALCRCIGTRVVVEGAAVCAAEPGVVCVVWSHHLLACTGI